MSLISVIVTTYNRPDALLACLNSLLAQSDRDFEILIADDGSGPATRAAIDRFKRDQPSPIRIQHVYQDDHGFRAAAIRNHAVARSRADYLVFIDGDCVLFRSFIARHRKLAQRGYFVSGNRILLSGNFTTRVLAQEIPLHEKSLPYFLCLFLTRRINHFFTLIALPLGFLRRMNKHSWKKVKTCNLGLWREDFIAVNGFDESFEGWGYEDSDLVIRLIHAGICKKAGRHAVPVLHLWHPENDRSRESMNYQKLLRRLKDSTCILAEQGYDRYEETRS